jgi:hypothetical protein
MRVHNFFTIILICCFAPFANAFEPVSIDDFFKKYPDERPVQPTISTGNKKAKILLQEKNKSQNARQEQQSNDDIIEKNIIITTQTYPQVEILLIDRILGRSEHIKLNVGETKVLNPLFDVTISECLERKNQFNNIVQIALMRVDGYANSKKDTQKTVLYDDVFYIQMPGFKGFEHPVYDIKPMKCLGNPQSVTLDEALEQNDVTFDTPLVPSQEDKDVKTQIDETATKKTEKLSGKEKNNDISTDIIEDIINNDRQGIQIPSPNTPIPFPVE